jgi:hypothetical protein
MSSGLIKRCLVAANSIAQINKDGLFSSLLNQWFMRYKSQKPPSFLVQETDHVIQFETRIFNSIRQSNIQSQNRKQFKTVLFEIKQLRDDIRKLFEYMQVRINTAQGATPGSSIMTHQDHLIAELVSAMGIGKVDYEDVVSISMTQSRDMNYLENPAGKSQDGTLRCSSMLPSNVVPRVNIQLSPSNG